MKKLAEILRLAGMPGVLLMLCAFFSWATFREQSLSGRPAGEALGAHIRTAASPLPWLLIGRDLLEDREFAEGFQQALDGQSNRLAGVVLGDPRSARLALQKLNDQSVPLAGVVTPIECVSWTVLQDLGARFPNLGPIPIRTPLASRWPAFLTRQNFVNIANQIVVVAILAAGMTLVVLSGGIDLSVGSLVALSAVIGAKLVERIGGGAEAGIIQLCFASAGGLAAATAFGAASGAVITRFQLPPFIATLAGMQVASGLAFLLAKGQSIYELPPVTTWLGRGSGGLPPAVWVMTAIYLSLHALLTRTVYGRHLYAVGGNEAAARLSGVKVRQVRLRAYVVCAALAGLGGLILTSQLKSAAPTYGLNYELYAIAAVVVGGTSLTGGRGNIFGTFIGTLMIAVIQNGMNLLGVESYLQKVVLGLVILGAVLLDQLQRSWGGSQFR